MVTELDSDLIYTYLPQAIPKHLQAVLPKQHAFLSINDYDITNSDAIQVAHEVNIIYSNSKREANLKIIRQRVSSQTISIDYQTQSIWPTQE